MDISGKLLDHFKSSEPDAYINVFRRLAEYPDYLEEYAPNVPFQKLLDGYELYVDEELVKDKTGFVGNNNKFLEDNVQRSIRRTKKQIYDYVQCNDFDLFGTFTFRSDRQDIQKCKERMSIWLTNQKKLHGPFDHLIVAEFHKDNESIHFHVLFKNFKGKLVLARNHHTHEPLKKRGKQLYNFDGYRLGINTAEFITSKKKAGSYLRKYITKDMPLFPGKKRYWASRGLKKPVITYNPEPYYRDYKIIDVYWNDLGLIVRYAYPRDDSEVVDA